MTADTRDASAIRWVDTWVNTPSIGTLSETWESRTRTGLGFTVTRDAHEKTAGDSTGRGYSRDTSLDHRGV